VFASPHLAGRASPPKPFYRGAWLGFGLGFTRAHFYRSLLESHAAEFREAQARLRELGASDELREVIVAGGGSRSGFWNQLKADILGSKYRRLVDSDLSTLRGDAMIAARARGWPVLDGEQAFLQFDQEYTPDPEAAEQYAKVLGDYRTFTSGLDGVMANLFS
jgi:xylulokinase